MKVIAKNKYGYFNFNLYKKYQSGIILYGWEVKSIKNGDVNINNSYIFIKNNEVYITNMTIKKYPFMSNKIIVNETRNRKLLLKKNEILNIKYFQKTQNYIIIPLKIFIQKNLLKTEIGLGKTIKKIDKRDQKKLKITKKTIKNYY